MTTFSEMIYFRLCVEIKNKAKAGCFAKSIIAVIRLFVLKFFKALEGWYVQVLRAKRFSVLQFGDDLRRWPHSACASC